MITRHRALALLSLVALLCGGSVSAGPIPRVTGSGGVAQTIESGLAPDSFGPWTIVSQGSDQDVVNSTTVVSSNLCMTIAPDRLYEVQVNLLIGSLPAASGYRYILTAPANTFGVWRSYDTSGTPCIFPCAEVATGGISFNQPIRTRIWYGLFRAPVSPDPGGTLCVKFANSVAGVGNTTRLVRTSTLVWRQLD